MEHLARSIKKLPQHNKNKIEKKKRKKRNYP